MTNYDGRLRREVRRLFDQLRSLEGWALAGPQVGLDLAVLVVDCPGLRAVLVNPTLFDVVSAETVEWEECVSEPGLRWRVPRASGVVVTARDERGRRVHVSMDGAPARCLQHAVDHLRGRLPSERALVIGGLPTVAPGVC